MAENRTKDIWNDDDGEQEESRRKRHLLRNFLIFLLVLAAVLGIVLAAAWRDGTGFDALHRYFAYGNSSSGGEKTVFRYDPDSSNRFAEVGDGCLAVLSDTSLRLLGKDGSEVWSANVQMTSPALSRGGGRAAAYDIGGTSLYVLDENGACMTLTTEGADCFRKPQRLRYAGGDGAGRAAPRAASMSTPPTARQLAEVNAHRRFVADACVTEDGKALAVVLMGQEDGRLCQRCGVLRSDHSPARRRSRRSTWCRTAW